MKAMVWVEVSAQGSDSEMEQAKVQEWASELGKELVAVWAPVWALV